MPHHILISPVTFKGSLRAREAALAMHTGVRGALPDAEVTLLPLSDGGEGLLDVLVEAMGATVRTIAVRGPLPGQQVVARWGSASGGEVAVIEMAEAAGLALVSEDRRDPRITTTYGVGELIRAALDEGAREIIVGIGGSSTNDGGAGMAEALGAELLDSEGNPLGPGGAALASLATVSVEHLDPRLRGIKLTVACDATNPLTGPNGASCTYAPQKGADAEMARMLDAALRHYAHVLRHQLGRDVEHMPGSGAAGGLGGGLRAFCDAELLPGIEIVLRVTGFDLQLAGKDLVLTGEGRLDAQTRWGKALSGVLRHAHALRVPVAAVVGSVEGTPSDYTGEDGFLAVATLVDERTSAEIAMTNAAHLLRDKTRNLLLTLTASLS